MSATRWERLVRQSLLRRARGDEFQELAKFMSEKSKTPGIVLIQAIVQCRLNFSMSSDPLIPQYVRAAVTSSLSHPSDVLYVLIENWNSTGSDQGLAAELEKPGCLSLPDSLIINDLAVAVASSSVRCSASEARRSLSLASRWLVALAGWISQGGGNRTYLAILTLLEALGILFASVISTEQGMLLLSSQEDLDLKSQVVDALETALPLLTSISVQLHTRLDMIQKHFNLFRHDITKYVDPLLQHSHSVPDSLQFEANIVDEPKIHARASLYIYFNAALCSRPTVEDTSLISYLNVRYDGNHVSMFIDTIIATFDVLSNGQNGNEGEHAMNIYRSFMLNKLPRVLSLISSSSLEPIPASFCISQAFGRIDLGAFPPSTYEMTRRSSLAGIRQEFLFACALHRLISEASIETLLGENPMQNPPSHGLYEKDELVQQIAGNARRGEQLIREIELTEGNAGVVVVAIVEVIHSHCRNKDTLPLKDMCNLIVRKRQIIDIIGLFRSPAHFLGPLCSLLDNWNWDELHGESQPVYEEFGAVLLLVLTVTHRYELAPSEIGITSSMSFVRQLLETEAAEQPLDDLDGSKWKHLEDWIAALFVADSLSDELTSSCSPHEFYILLPTLLCQSIEACETGKMSIESLKSGFDYLLEPFLLPSLVVAFRWLANHLWRTANGAKISLYLLQSLLKAPSSTEAGEIRQTILSMIAEPLHLQVQAIAAEDSQKQLGLAITDAISPYITLNRNIDCMNETPQLLSASPRSVLGLLRQTFHQLLEWSTGLEVNNSPPKFTFKLISTAVQLHGSSKVLLVFLKELKMLLRTDKFNVGQDILTSIICAQSSRAHALKHGLSFLDALKILHAELAKTLEAGDTLFAEVVVRLYRRVEAFSMASLQQEMTIDPVAPIGSDLAGIHMGNLNLDKVPGNSEIDVATLGVQPTAEDLDQILDGAAGMETFGTNNMGSGTDDVFGLEGGDMHMMNFDDMDLEGMF